MTSKQNADYPRTLFLDTTPSTGRKVQVMTEGEFKSLGDGDWKDQPSVGVTYEEVAVARQLAPEGEEPDPATKPRTGNAGLLRAENNTERGRLEWQARDIGMPVDRRWSNETLRSYIYQWQTGGEYERDKITAEVTEAAPTAEASALLRTMDLDPAGIEGTGPNGEVTEADVRKHTRTDTASQAAAQDERNKRIEKQRKDSAKARTATTDVPKTKAS